VGGTKYPDSVLLVCTGLTSWLDCNCFVYAVPGNYLLTSSLAGPLDAFGAVLSFVGRDCFDEMARFPNTSERSSVL
jgi:hypothetical protein